VTRYVDWTFRNNRYCGEQKAGFRAYCHPDNFAGVTNILYHNNGDGTLPTSLLRPESLIPRAKDWACLSRIMTATVFTDIFVANDSVQSFLYHNNGNGTFTEVGLLAGVGYNEDGKTFAGMGADFQRFRQ